MSGSINVEIIASGSELMLGRLVDTNSAWLSRTLAEAGFPTVRHSAVGDDLPRLVDCFRRAWHDNELIVVTGGIGPTEDDLTRQAAAEAFGLKLEYHEQLAAELRALFAARGYSFTDNNLRQVWLPSGALTVPNPLGTAPGFALTEPDKLMVFLPGVPSEMKAMVSQWLLPRLKSQFPQAAGFIKTVFLKTAGLGESLVDHKIHDLMGVKGDLQVGLLAGLEAVRVVVTARGRSQAQAEELLAEAVAELDGRLQGHIFGRDEESLAEVLARLLAAKALRLTVVDALSQGRLTGFLGPSLAPENWGGGLDLPWRPRWFSVQDLAAAHNESSALGPVATDELRLLLTGRPEPQAEAAQELSVLVETAVEGLGFAGLRLRSSPLAGPRDWTLKRAAMAASFHLWQLLSAYEA